eukprot:753785-Hanusia_phi.AAC.4
MMALLNQRLVLKAGRYLILQSVVLILMAQKSTTRMSFARSRSVDAMCFEQVADERRAAAGFYLFQVQEGVYKDKRVEG